MTRRLFTCLAAFAVLAATPACSQPAGAAKSGGGESKVVKAGTDISPIIKAAKPGTTILLAPGAYPSFGVFSQSFSPAVTIASADPAHPAIIPGIEVSQAGGVIFRDLELKTPDGPGLFTYRLYDCHDITFQRVNVHGSLDGDPQNDKEGIAFYGCDNFSIVDSEFHELVRAVTGGPSQDPKFKKAPNRNVTISRNKFHTLQVTGMMLSAVEGGMIANNYITAFHVVMGTDHPDAIQFLTGTNGNTLAPSRDVTITGNLITRGAGNIGMQGIFVTDEQGDLPPTDFTVSDNLMIGSGYNGIALYHAKGAKISGNALHSYDGDQLKTWIVTTKSNGIRLAGNQAILISNPEGSDIKDEGGNVRNKPVDMKKIGAIEAEWRAKHPQVPK